MYANDLSVVQEAEEELTVSELIEWGALDQAEVRALRQGSLRFGSLKEGHTGCTKERVNRLGLCIG